MRLQFFGPMASTAFLSCSSSSFDHRPPPVDVLDPLSVDFFLLRGAFFTSVGTPFLRSAVFDDDDAFAAALPGAVCVQLIPPLGCELGTFPYLLRKAF